ncbi:hypothetical protein GDO81_011627 [Engystomops pustulosus]|uniref:Uncharacterized protein n=1 Tax=Engystomops pustulosus TaxID=76066 RepID=A0AAV7BFU7_ENGPU|nr:hypothetical protein GDO81_011627 [Engystomops pustulosus]
MAFCIVHYYMGTFCGNHMHCAFIVDNDLGDPFLHQLIGCSRIAYCKLQDPLHHVFESRFLGRGKSGMHDLLNNSYLFNSLLVFMHLMIHLDFLSTGCHGIWIICQPH